MMRFMFWALLPEQHHLQCCT